VNTSKTSRTSAHERPRTADVVQSYKNKNILASKSSDGQHLNSASNGQEKNDVLPQSDSRNGLLLNSNQKAVDSSNTEGIKEVAVNQEKNFESERQVNNNLGAVDGLEILTARVTEPSRSPQHRNASEHALNGDEINSNLSMRKESPTRQKSKSKPDLEINTAKSSPQDVSLGGQITPKNAKPPTNSNPLSPIVRPHGSNLPVLSTNVSCPSSPHLTATPKSARSVISSRSLSPVSRPPNSRLPVLSYEYFGTKTPTAGAHPATILLNEVTRALGSSSSPSRKPLVKTSRPISTPIRTNQSSRIKPITRATSTLSTSVRPTSPDDHRGQRYAPAPSRTDVRSKLRHEGKGSFLLKINTSPITRPEGSYIPIPGSPVPNNTPKLIPPRLDLASAPPTRLRLPRSYPVNMKLSSLFRI
jgi:hypothetical protein